MENIVNLNLFSQSTFLHDITHGWKQFTLGQVFSRILTIELWFNWLIDYLMQKFFKVCNFSTGNRSEQLKAVHVVGYAARETIYEL